MPIILPITCDKPAAVVARSAGMEGSLRQRGLASWELRVYAGTDADTGRRRYRSATVHGNRADAERALAVLVADVRSTKTIGVALDDVGAPRGMVRDRVHFVGADHDPPNPLGP